MKKSILSLFVLLFCITTTSAFQIHNVQRDIVGDLADPIFAAPRTCDLGGNIEVEATGGVNASYTTLGAAFAAINTGTHTGTITIDVCADTSEGATTAALNASGTGSASYTAISISPAGAPRIITGANTAALIKLNGADGVTIDGSTVASPNANAVGGDPSLRQLTMTNTGTGAVIWIATDATSGATNNTVKNCILVGPGAFTGQGFIAGSGATFGAGAENGRPNSNNTIQNNRISRVQNAAFIFGDITTRDQNWSISENDIGSATVADKVTFRGLLINNGDNFTMSQNRISGVTSSTTTSSTMSGILIAGIINGGSITRNEIKDIRQNNTAGWGSNGIYLAASSPAPNLLIANNMVSDVASVGFNGNEPADNGYGIVVEGAGGGYNIYHNTVVMNGNETTAGITAALLIDESATTAGAVNLRNNILVNSQTVGTNYSVYVDVPVTNTVFSAINYNDYFSSENVGNLGGTIRTTLADWQTATAQDANSKSVDPLFVSATNFHLQAASTLLGMGTPIASVTNDFDRETREAIPDIGADEIVSVSDSTAPVITYTAIPVNSLNPTLSATITDAVGVTGATIFWSINGGGFTSAGCSLSGGNAQSGTWSCTIGGMANPNAVKYYVTATDAALNTSTNPTGGATAPNLFTFGAATVPAGTYTNMSLGNGVSLGGNVDILSSLTLNGIVNAGANKLTLECIATVSGGGEGSYVIGNVEKFICGAATFTYNVGAPFGAPPVVPEETVAEPEGAVSNYSPLTVTITAGTSGSSLTVSVTDAFMGGAMQTNAISRFWTLTENGNLTANLAFTYRNEDVVGTETSYKVLRRTGSSTFYFAGGTVNAATNTFSAPNVSDFSQWTAGTLVPTAANASISGRAVNAMGRGLANVTVNVFDAERHVVSSARTNSFGYFTLYDVPVGADYIVTVSAKRYGFDPSSFVVSLTDNITDLLFVASQ